MKSYLSLSNEELTELISEKRKKYSEYKSQNLSLDMSRGKPCKEQLDLCLDMLNGSSSYKSPSGVDCRNYGGVEGLKEARELFGALIGAPWEQVIVSGNSSLNVMYDTVARAMSFGVNDKDLPWSKQGKIKFLCPSPGYDRHFAITELFGIEMIIVDMKSDGPDMDKIEELVSADSSIKGIWCIPQYSNPDGIIYSDEVVDRFARLKPKASDFRIFWDNAYAVHHLTDKKVPVKNILTACQNAGNPDMVYVFTSTSKISFAGAGISVMASSVDNMKRTIKQMSIQTIGPDKINQLKHVEYFKTVEGINAHMEKHAKILAPKFKLVLETLQRELSGKEIAWWNEPNGGYFVSLNTMDNCAKEVVKMAKEAGVVLTNAGATFPYGKDPLDRNIRIAPSFPPLDELKQAIDLLCLCVEIVSCEKILASR